MITHDQMLVIDKFADDLRRQFPLTNDTHTFIEEIQQIIHQHIWEAINIFQNQYHKEFELTAQEMEKDFDERREMSTEIGMGL